MRPGLKAQAACSFPQLFSPVVLSCSPLLVALQYKTILKSSTDFD